MHRKLQGFQLIAQEKLQAILCSIPGKKDLILQQLLIKQLEHICSASWLKWVLANKAFKHFNLLCNCSCRFKGIDRIYKFDDSNIPSFPDQHAKVQVFMLRSELSTFQRILDHLLSLKVLDTIDPEVSLKRYHLICIPSCLAHFQIMLEEQGLWGVVQLHAYSWDFICLDESLISLEIPNVSQCCLLKACYYFDFQICLFLKKFCKIRILKTCRLLYFDTDRMFFRKAFKTLRLIQFI